MGKEFGSSIVDPECGIRKATGKGWGESGLEQELRDWEPVNAKERLFPVPCNLSPATRNLCRVPCNLSPVTCSLILALVVSGLSGALERARTGGATAASRVGISREAAKSLEAKIQLLSAATRGKPASVQPIVVTEVETNSYLRYNGPEFLPPGVNDPEIHISPESINGTADVDFNQLNQASKADDWGSKTLAMAFPGKQRVSATGRLDTSGGQGKVTIQNVRVGTFAVPDALVSFLLESYVQKRYKIDLGKLPLPDHVTRIELGRGNATFYR
jgi:hypothetical protein